MANIHNISIPKEVLDTVKQKITEINEALKPYVTALTPAERSDLAKLGDKTLAFVEKTKNYSTESPQLLPAYFDSAAFAIDYADYENLRPVVNLVEQTLHNVEDTMMLAGSEAYIASLSFYNSVKDAAKRDVPGAKAVYDDLRLRFPQASRKTSNDSTQTP